MKTHLAVWKTDAACREARVELFFPEARNGRYTDREAMNRAFSLCDRCPVAVECWEYAKGLKLPAQGIWGGQIWPHTPQGTLS